MNVSESFACTTPVIGIFDSGLGGLTVVKALREKAPGLSLVYFGDTARFPYGTKSASTIVRYAIENTGFLIDQGAQVIIIACNTATATALPYLQSHFSIPIYGVIEPAAQRAVELTKNKNIGVIATSRTVKTRSYTKAILQLLPEAHVTAIACPLLVSLIEDGAPSEEIKRLIIREYLRPFHDKQIDTLLLGCTHYPLVESLIQETLGTGVTIVDPAKTCADIVAADFPQAQNPIPSSTFRFFASDDTVRFRAIGEAFLGMKMGKVQHTR